MTSDSLTIHHSPATPMSVLINRLRTSFRNSDFVETENELILREQYLNRRISNLTEINQVLESEFMSKEHKFSELAQEIDELKRELNERKEAEAETRRRYECMVEYSRLLENQEDVVRVKFEEDRAELEAELRGLRRRLAEKDEEFEELRKRNAEELERRLAEKEEKFEEKGQYAEELGKRLVEKGEEFEELTARNEELERRLGEKEEEFEDLRQRNAEELDRRLVEKEEFEELRQRHAQEWERRLMEKEEEFEELRQRNAEEMERRLVEKREECEARNAEELEKRLAEKEDEFELLKRRDKKEFERSLAEKDEELEGLRQQNAEEFERRSAEKEEELEGLRQRNAEELERRLTEKEKELEGLRQRNAEELERRLTEKEKELEVWRQRNAEELERRLTEKEKELEVWRQRNAEELERRLEEKEKELEVWRQRNAEELERMSEEKKERIRELTKKMEEYSRLLENQEDTVRTRFEEEKVEFEMKLSSLQGRLADKEGEIMELTRKVEELERKNKEDLDERYNEVIRIAKEKNVEIVELEKEKEVLKLENSKVSVRLKKIESFFKLNGDVIAEVDLDVGNDLKVSWPGVGEVLCGILSEFESEEDGIGTGNGGMEEGGNNHESGSGQTLECRGGGVGQGSLMQLAGPGSKDSGSSSDGAVAQTAPPSRHEARKREDWNAFLKFLRNCTPPLCPSSCSGAHVLEFLKYLNQLERTKVYSCLYCGQIAPCACPHEQKWRKLDALICRLRAAYEESGGNWESNPFGARVVQSYLQEVREGQASARGKSSEKKRKRPSTYTSGAAVETVAEVCGGRNIYHSTSGFADAVCHGMSPGKIGIKRRIEAENLNHLHNQVDGMEGSARPESHLIAAEIQVQVYEEENEQHLPLYDEVIRQGGDVWSCKLCDKSFSSSYAGIHHHFLGAPVGQGESIQRCLTLSTNIEELDRIKKKVEEAEKIGISPSLRKCHLEAEHFHHGQNPCDGIEGSTCPKSYLTAEDDQVQTIKEENKRQRPLYDEVIREGGNKWTCRHCKKSFKSSYTRIRNHFLGPPLGQTANIKRCMAVLENKEELCRIENKSKLKELSSLVPYQ